MNFFKMLWYILVGHLFDSKKEDLDSQFANAMRSPEKRTWLYKTIDITWIIVLALVLVYIYINYIG